MKKRITALSVIVLLLLSMAGCSSSSGETMSGEIGLKEAVDKDGPQVWYWIADSSVGKDSEVSGVFVFDDGQMTIYDRQVWYNDVNGTSAHPGKFFNLGTISEYLELDTEDAIKLAEERYVKVQEDYVQYLRDENEDSYEYDLNSIAGNHEHAEEFYNNRTRAIDEVEKGKITERESYQYKIVNCSDQTGNNTGFEAIIADDVIYPTGYIIKFTDGDGLTFPGGKSNFSISFDYPSEIFEIYDNYVGGYSVMNIYFNKYNTGYDRGCFVTKCSQDTVFNIDPMGTSGIIDDPEVDENGKVITEPNK